MKKNQILFAIMLTLACLGVIGVVTVSGVNTEPSAYGSAQSGNLMLTVSAVQHQDGSVDGHATFRDRATNSKVDIDIDCLTIGSGTGIDDAVLSGVISKSTFPDFLIGNQVAFTIRDNGEGQNAKPDQFTPPGGAKGPCTIGVIFEFLTSEKGNLVVNANS